MSDENGNITVNDVVEVYTGMVYVSAKEHAVLLEVERAAREPLSELPCEDWEKWYGRLQDALARLDEVRKEG